MAGMSSWRERRCLPDEAAHMLGMESDSGKAFCNLCCFIIMADGKVKPKQKKERKEKAWVKLNRKKLIWHRGLTRSIWGASACDLGSDFLSRAMSGENRYL
jgi:hypothetical protein